MSEQEPSRDPARTGLRALSPRTIVGIAIVVLLIVFIAINRDDTHVSFIVFSTTVELWVALALASFGGLVAGFLIARRRYRA
ncbi:MAG TPA: hypothetical protein VIC82_07525 [Candidatus Nanopelagicales bacterium]